MKASVYGSRLVGQSRMPRLSVSCSVYCMNHMAHLLYSEQVSVILITGIGECAY